MKTLKILLMFVLVLGIAAAVIACGGSDTSETKAPETAKETKGVIKTIEETDAPETEAPAPSFAPLQAAEDSSKFYKFVEFPLPEDFREAAVQGMRDMANVEWKVAKTFKTTEDFKDEGWGITLEYGGGLTWHGLPYANTYSMKEEFENFYLDANRSYTQDTEEWIKTPGVQCASSIIAALQKFSSITGTSTSLSPVDKDFQEKIVGEYTYEIDMPTPDVTAQNKPAVMNAAYALCEKGDVIYTRNAKKATHVRMVVDNNVATKSDGSIVGNRSYLTTIEQTNSIDKTRKDGVNTTWWVDHQYTYETLFSTGYIPVTIWEYTEGNKVAPYLAMTSEVKAEDLAGGSFNFSIETNSCMRYVYADILTRDGKLVKRACRNNVIDEDGDTQMGSSLQKVDMRKYSYSLFTDLPAGDYTFVVTAGIAAGSAEMARVDFTYSK